MTGAMVISPPDWIKLGRLLARGYVDSGVIGGVSRLSADDLVAATLSEARVDEQIAEMRRYEDLDGKRILEVGSGCGMLVVRGRTAHGLDIHGLEPSGAEFAASREVCDRLLAHYGLPADLVRDGIGEAIPFPDGSFDVVYSSNVLEHVGDPERVLDESLRVLKPGGLLLFVVPNYGSWWEGHYGILWLPGIGRAFAKRYVRLFGRDPSYIDTLHLIDHRRLARWAVALADRVAVLDWGWEVFERRLRTLEFTEWASLSLAKRAVRWVHRLGLLEPVIRLARRCHWETPIILAARKSGGT